METLVSLGRVKCSKIIEAEDKTDNTFSVPESADVDDVNGNDDARFFENLKKKFNDNLAASSQEFTKSRDILNRSTRKRRSLYDKETERLINTFKLATSNKDEIHKSTLNAFHKSSSENPISFSDNSSHDFCFEPINNTARHVIRPYDNSGVIYPSKKEYKFRYMKTNMHKSYSRTESGIYSSAIDPHMESLISNSDDPNDVIITDPIYSDIFTTAPRSNDKLWE